MRARGEWSAENVPGPGSRLGELAWPEVPGGSVLVVPLGSCEQHGPHLPLDTDTRVAMACAAGLAEAEDRLVVAPAVTIGASGEHAGFPGTLSIGTAALVEVLVEIVRSALPPPGAELPRPFRGVVIVNGHGGNVEAVTLAVDRLRAEGRAVLAWHPRVPGGDSHAGRTETSLLLHLCPEVVRTDLIAPGSTARWREIGAVVREQGLAAVTPGGVLGDPTPATAAEGASVLADLVADLSAAVRGWRATLGG
ncbi:MAG: mycofactocin biosynthesis peptidyl-dipeptidase MftE [Microthrixaceae bacterium]